MPKNSSKSINTLAQEIIEGKILVIREQKIMLDRDLAELYGVETKALNQAVKRNLDRFPDDFMFKLTKKEKLKVVTICDRLQTLKYSPQLPFVFTEHGILMLSSILNSPRAIQVNIQIMRTFTNLRKFAIGHTKLKRKIEAMEEEYDLQFKIVFDAIKRLLNPSEKPKKPIDFHAKKEKQYAR